MHVIINYFCNYILLTYLVCSVFSMYVCILYLFVKIKIAGNYKLYFQVKTVLKLIIVNILIN